MKNIGPVTKFKTEFAEKMLELKDLKDKYLRTLADTDNYRKRRDKEVEEFKKYSKIEFFMQIIPVVENFDRALSGVELTQDLESFYKGLAIIARSLKDTLKKLGLEEFSALGAEFDPNVHDAIGVVEKEDAPANIVAEEISKGYRVEDRIIKPAKVIVTKSPEGGNKNGENNRD